jgi:phosphinothricin acetyltransferase
MKIRIAEIADLKSIVDIYNQAVVAGKATADMMSITVEDRLDWFAAHNKDQYPLYVLETEEKILGWGSLSPYRNGRDGLKSTAEISYYLDYHHHGLGYGKMLIDYMLKDCERLNIHNVFALLLEVNERSAGILESFGFEKWGFMPNVVNMNGLICGHLILGKNLRPNQ